MGSSVLHADRAAYLRGWYRTKLAARPESYCSNVIVASIEPPPPAAFPARLLVIRDDGATRTSLVTADAAIGLTVFAGTKAKRQDAIDLALMVLALAEQIPGLDVGNPFTVLRGSAGPFDVAEAQDRARQYLTLDLAVAGVPL